MEETKSKKNRKVFESLKITSCMTCFICCCKKQKIVIYLQN